MKRRLISLTAAGLLLAALSATPICAAAPPVEGAHVGQWKTYHLASPDEITVPAPPADTSDQTKAELNELRLAQTLRSPILNKVVENWDGLNAVKRWSDVGARIPLHPVFGARINAYMHTAILDAVVVAYRAKYTYNRKPPAELATDLTPSGTTVAGDPSYPSEHAAIAGAASAVLASLFPDQAKTYEAMAQEEAFSRLIAGRNYRSDIEAGLALGRAVAEKAIARAKSDGSDGAYTGTTLTGPAYWIGTPVGLTKGQWRPWLMTSGSQCRPAPPPAPGSPEFAAALADVKRRATTMTASEKAIFDFWSANNLPAVFTDLAFALMSQEGASPARAARVMAAVATSADDSIISAWDAKFYYWSLRPIQADPTIPLLAPTPPYPDYTSGFTAFITGLSEPIGYFFPSELARLRQIQEEGAIKRVYMGIHFKFATDAALVQGRQVGQLVAERDKANDL
jgi:hypothetical protein